MKETGKEDALWNQITEVLDGTASDEILDRIAESDALRDARHDAERAARLIADAGADFKLPSDFEHSLMQAIEPGESGSDDETANPRSDHASPNSASQTPAGEHTAGEHTAGEHTAGEHTAGEHTAESGVGSSASPAAVEPATPSPIRSIETRPQTPESGATPSSLGTSDRSKSPESNRSTKLAGETQGKAKPSAKNSAIRWGGAALGLLAAAGAALLLRPNPHDQLPQDETASWSGRVLHISSANGNSRGLELCNESGSTCKAATQDLTFEPGQVIKTDAVTRAQLKLDDGSRITLDRSTHLHVLEEPKRGIELKQGAIVADVAKNELAPARFVLPIGNVEVLGTKFALRVANDFSAVDVSRGSVKLSDKQGREVVVRSGEEGRVYADIPPYVSAAPALAEAIAWSESASGEPKASTFSRGLGELKARKPGSQDELAGAVELSKHSVKVRISGAVARTEIEEVFTNTTDQVLEGIYRFPIPPDAKIDRLALEVDGKLVDGAFVDRDRAAAIWRGTLVNAAPKLKQQIRDEIIWVPGPWKDPALLEWQRGGRFELRIFPIPKRGSRRVVLAYSQLVKPSGNVRRYSYALAHDPGGSTKVKHFEADIQVRGHDADFGVRSHGYALSRSREANVQSLAFTAENFTPSGDLILEYALPNRDSELRSWAYLLETEKAAPPGRPRAKQKGKEPKTPEGAYVALALRPKLPRSIEAEQRAFAFVVDASRSMYGETYKRASQVVVRAIRELDPLDRIAVLACDVTCRSLPGGLRTPGAQTAREAEQFLGSVTPEGASDLTGAIREARHALDSANGQRLRIVYFGDGAPTVGAIRPAQLTSSVARTMPASLGTVTTVAVGNDSDLQSLAAVARGGGGAILPFVPGQTVAEMAFAVLGATYGSSLRDVAVKLPDGMIEVAPKRLDTIIAGSETLVVAKLTEPVISGEVVLRGKLGKQRFEQRYPVEINASSNPGNAFVPRLFAAQRIADLEREPALEAKKLAIELSTQYGVASRYTSLLVLESAAMFRAFGINNERRTPEWTGEDATQSAETRGLVPLEEKSEALHPYFDARGAGKGADFTDGIAPEAEMAPRPATRRAPRPAARPAPALKRRRVDDLPAPAPTLPRDEWTAPPTRRRTLIPMRRVWERTGNIITDVLVPKSARTSELSAARFAFRENEQQRDALEKFYVLSMLAGELTQAEELSELWSTKEPLDPEALTARADVAARLGQRDRAIRILGSVLDVRRDLKAQRRLARLHRWAGQPELACRYTIAMAQVSDQDEKLLAEAVRCSRAIGQRKLAEELLGAVSGSLRDRVEALLEKEPVEQNQLLGDLRVEASWGGVNQDLDLAFIHPDGHRVSWLGAPTRAVITATDVVSTRREGLALRGAKPGQYVIEVVRARGEGQVQGELEIHSAGRTRRIPFTLDGTRVVVALAEIKMRSRLVRAR